MANKKTKKQKRTKKQKELLVEVCRSFGWKLSLPNYENRDFFQSAKSEVPESKADEISDKLYLFCKTKVINSVNEFLAEINKGLQIADLKKNPIWAELVKYFKEGGDKKEPTEGKQSLDEKRQEETQLQDLKVEQKETEELAKL